MKPRHLLLIPLAISQFFFVQAAYSQPPELRVDEWVHLPEGLPDQQNPQKDWEGKVVDLYFFQSWCPGCHSSGLPSLQTLLNEFKDHPDVRFASVQTVFEGFHTNTPAAALEIVERYGLQSIPVGQSGSSKAPSKVMSDFKTRGTPWTVIINKEGKIVYSDFHIKPQQGIELINRLLEADE